MCVKIMESEGKLDKEEYDFFLKGGVVLDRNDQVWRCVFISKKKKKDIAMYEVKKKRFLFCFVFLSVKVTK